MKTSITLEEVDIKIAIKEYLNNQGKRVDAEDIHLHRGGVEDSPDPREYAFIYATADNIKEQT